MLPTSGASSKFYHTEYARLFCIVAQTQNIVEVYGMH